jgi:hypothetical protein
MLWLARRSIRRCSIYLPSACARASSPSSNLPSGLVPYKTAGKEDVECDRENVSLLGDGTGLQARPLSFDNVLNELILFMISGGGVNTVKSSVCYVRISSGL